MAGIASIGAACLGAPDLIITANYAPFPAARAFNRTAVFQMGTAATAVFSASAARAAIFDKSIQFDVSVG